MHAYPCVEYWYHFSSVLPTSLLHSFALLFIVFLPIPLCNCLLFWSLLIAEMLIPRTAPGHPPARKSVRDMRGGLLQGGVYCRGEVWRKTTATHQATFELFSYSISSHKSFLWLHCLWENSSSHLYPLPTPPCSSCTTDRWEKNSNDLTVFCKARAEGKRKLLAGSSLTVICDSGTMRAEEEEGGLR